MTTKTGSWWDRARGWVLGFGLGAVLGALSAGYVYVEGRERMVALDRTRDAELEEVNRLTDEGRAALEAARSTEALLRARIAASAAVDEVDAANFGLAQDHLRTVAASLSQVDPVLAGVEPGALNAARQTVDAAIAQVSPNAVSLRERMVEVERAVDTLLPRAPQG